jgi:adenine-specific DNA-methyltransferase
LKQSDQQTSMKWSLLIILIKKHYTNLILYYLDERNNAGNFQLKQLVITNINQWYIIDANHFDKHIYNNSKIKTLYKTYKNDNKTNPWFYDEVSKIIATLDIEIPCVYFDIKEYDKNLRNDNKVDDKQFSALYKILSAQHLLKTSTPNDSNSLNEKFYKELLHIIGLEEAKEGGKNIIRRKKENRSSASLIEVTMDALHI